MSKSYSYVLYYICIKVTKVVTEFLSYCNVHMSETNYGEKKMYGADLVLFTGC